MPITGCFTDVALIAPDKNNDEELEDKQELEDKKELEDEEEGYNSGGEESEDSNSESESESVDTSDVPSSQVQTAPAALGKRALDEISDWLTEGDVRPPGKKAKTTPSLGVKTGIPLPESTPSKVPAEVQAAYYAAELLRGSWDSTHSLVLLIEGTVTLI